MKGSSILLASLWLSAATACNPASRAVEPRSALEVTPAAQKVSQGQDVRLTVQLKNTGSQDLWVNRRMLLNAHHSPVTMRELWLEVVGPDGGAIPFSSRVRAGAAGASDFGVLRPGQGVSKEIALSSGFELKQAGVYRVTAHYRDGADEVPKAPEGAAHLREELSSATATFELVTRP